MLPSQDWLPGQELLREEAFVSLPVLDSQEHVCALCLSVADKQEPYAIKCKRCRKVHYCSAK
jgi:hypothetical protein